MTKVTGNLIEWVILYGSEVVVATASAEGFPKDTLQMTVQEGVNITAFSDD